MPLVLPFCALRPAGSESLAERLSPPYDVIAPAERAHLARAEHNPVHLILPADDPAAGPGSRYAVAARTLAAWRASGALERDRVPAFYAYEQEFSHHGKKLVRRGFHGLLELRPFGQGGVFAHERTLTAPKEDRFRLLEATETNLSPVFVLYEDPAGEVRRALAAARARPPLARAGTAEGLEALWAVPDPAAAGGTPDPEAACAAAGVENIARILAAQGVVVADGHHRYESALRHRDAWRARAGVAAGERTAHDFMLACFVDVTDPGLLVLPTHRVVRGLPAVTAGALAERLAGTLIVTPLGSVAGDDVEGGAERAEAFLAAHPAGAFVFAPAGERALYGLEIPAGLRDRAFADSATPPVLRRLDVVQLHELLLGRGLGITPEVLAAQSNVEYVKAAAEALAITWDRGSGSGAVAGAAAERPPSAAFLMNGTPVAQVLEVGRAGERMPQKSTYFLPKITTGWLYHAHDDAAEVWGRGAAGRPWWRSAQA
jgi:uncharacterized protein (DUF1015 family)